MIDSTDQIQAELACPHSGIFDGICFECRSCRLLWSEGLSPCIMILLGLYIILLGLYITLLGLYITLKLEFDFLFAQT